MAKSNSSRAQGTIEYLVILAVIVVLSLVVVSLMTTIFVSPAEQITSTTNKLGSMNGSISIVDATTDSSGEGVVTFSNRSGENLVITKINIDGTDNTYSSSLPSGNERNFSIASLVGCDGSKKSYSVIIYYTAESGLTKQLNLGQIQINCSEDSTPSKPPEEHTNCIPSGKGTLAKPKIICDCNGLQNINNHTDWNYALGQDINCYETRNWNETIDGNFGFRPISDFSGSLDGKGKKIDYLFVNNIIDRESPDAGLFVNTAQGSAISNLSMENAAITGNNFTSILVGGMMGSNSSINNVHVSGRIDAYDVMGGIASENFADINNSSAAVTLNNINSSGFCKLGGLVGESWSGTISQCHSSGSVSCVTNYGNYAGGLVGEFRGGTLVDSYTTADVNGDAIVGGLVGSIDDGTIIRSYSSGKVFAGSQMLVGGIAGEVGYGTIIDSYTTSQILGFGYAAGAFIGRNYGTNNITNSYWDITRVGSSTGCGLGDCTGASGKNNANSQPNYFFDGNNPPMGPKPTKWDFTTIWNDNNTTQQYPTLK
ncbi:MAG: hypothetical protein WCW44_06130 [archaeon]|jgi:hypothetical protein